MNVIYSDDENSVWIDGVKYSATEYDGYGCYGCDISKLFNEGFCNIEHCIGPDRKDGREYIVFRKDSNEEI